MNSEGANTPPDGEGEAGGHDLADEEQQDQSDHDVAGDDRVHHRIADAVHLGQREQDEAQDGAADRRACPRGPALPHAIDVVLEGVEDRLEAQADQSGDDRQHAHEQVGGVVGYREVVGDQVEEGR